MSSPLFHPYLVLQIAEPTTDERVREAYRRLVLLFPPDHAPEQFQRLNHAYELVKTAELRARLRLFGGEGCRGEKSTLPQLVPPAPTRRDRLGVEAWLTILRKARP